MVSIIIGLAGLVLLVETFFAGGVAAAIAGAEQITLAALVAQYDLAVGRPLRRLLTRSDLAIGTTSVTILADEAISDGRLLDAEKILTSEGDAKLETESSPGPLKALLEEIYATTSILQSVLLIQVYALKGEKEKALALLTKTQKSAETAWGKDDRASREALSEFYTNAGYILSIVDQLERGIELLQQALERRAKTYGAESEQAAKTLNNLGVALQQADDLKAAYDALKKAQEILERNGKKSRKALGCVLDSLASVLADMGKAEEGYTLACRAIKIPYPAVHERTIRMFTLGKCLEGLNKDKQALSQYERALKSWSKMQGIKHPAIDQCRLRHDSLRTRLKQSKHA
jgi:tetratricopeptide (TPR) repeat protein